MTLLRHDLALMERRAEKAEKERDALRTEVNDLWPFRKRAENAEQSRGFTAEDVDGDMVNRAREVNSDLPLATVRRMLTAALTVPTRPEGADELERLIETSPWHLAGSCSAEADWLASRGVRVEGSGR